MASVALDVIHKITPATQNAYKPPMCLLIRQALDLSRLSPMNWTDTIGVTIHNDLVRSALKNKPEADIEKLESSVKRLSLSVGITRNSIASVLEAELEAMVCYRLLGDTSLSLDYLAGLQSAADLVRYGVHLTDGRLK
jgi:hypothetical protein